MAMDKNAVDTMSDETPEVKKEIDLQGTKPIFQPVTNKDHLFVLAQEMQLLISEIDEMAKDPNKDNLIFLEKNKRLKEVVDETERRLPFHEKIAYKGIAWQFRRDIQENIDSVTIHEVKP